MNKGKGDQPESAQDLFDWAEANWAEANWAEANWAEANTELGNRISPVTEPTDETPATDKAASDDDSPADNSPDIGELRPTVVRASAGSGKTYQLTARLLRILIQGSAPETILATTFTRKAAGEILDRLLESLASAADPDDHASLAALRSQVGLPTLPRSVCLSLVETLVRNIHRLRICTLDALFSQLARSFAFEMDLPPGWRLTDEIEEAWLVERAIDQTIASLDQSETVSLLSMLSKGEVKRSVTRELQSVIESTYRLAREANPDAWDQLTVAAQPDSKAITAAAGLMMAASPKQKSLKAKLEDIAGKLESRSLEGLESDTLVKNINKARRLGEPVKFGRSVFPDGLDEAFDVLYAAAKTEAIRLLRSQNQGTGSLAEIFDGQIRALKETNRGFGFDDVASRLAGLFDGFGKQRGAEAIQRRMDGSIDHLLLDEFQDTSPLQWRVLKPLAMLCTRQDDSASGGASAQSEAIDGSKENEKSFFCVGDTKQAIYGWRGGVAGIFDTVVGEIAGVEEVSQNLSFRSSPVIMETANAIFSRLDRHPLASVSDPSDKTNPAVYQARALQQFARHFPAHSTARSDLAGFAQVVTGKKVDGGSETQRTACYEAAASIVKDIHRSTPDSSIGILTRTNGGVNEMIWLLEQFGLDVSQEGGNPLIDSPAVELVLSVLMAVEHPGDGRWAFHLMGTPLQFSDEFTTDLLHQQLDDLGIAETIQLLAAKVDPVCNDRDSQRLQQLCQLAITHQAGPAGRVRDFVRMVREKKIQRPKSAPIRVMTIHQSKGLEFDAVVLVELDKELVRPTSAPVPKWNRSQTQIDGLCRYVGGDQWHFLPKDWQRSFGAATEASMTEALCLLYVAVTRARQAVHMVIAPAKKREFNYKTSASLIYHSLASETGAAGDPDSEDVDPTTGEQVLWQMGDEHWHQS